MLAEASGIGGAQLAAGARRCRAARGGRSPALFRAGCAIRAPHQRIEPAVTASRLLGRARGDAVEAGSPAVAAALVPPRHSQLGARLSSGLPALERPSPRRGVVPRHQPAARSAASRTRPRWRLGLGAERARPRCAAAGARTRNRRHSPMGIAGCSRGPRRGVSSCCCPGAPPGPGALDGPDRHRDQWAGGGHRHLGVFVPVRAGPAGRRVGCCFCLL